MQEISWTAVYENGEELEQYNEDHSENLFGAINQSQLIMFVLKSDSGKIWAVDLQDGSFRVGDEVIDFDGFESRLDYKLIYFRRVRRTMGMFGEDPSSQVTQHLGWQVNIDGKNYQRVMAIPEEGYVTFKIK